MPTTEQIEAAAKAIADRRYNSVWTHTRAAMWTDRDLACVALVAAEAVAGEWEYAAQNGRGEIMHVGSEKHMRKLVASLGFPEAVAVVRRPKPGPWSEIPEGQNDA